MPPARHKEEPIVRIEELIAWLEVQSDESFILAGKAEKAPVCAIAMWHIQVTHDVLQGNQWCGDCPDCTCASFTPCNLVGGDTEGCPFVGRCECAIPWNHSYLPDRIKPFRAWAIKMLSVMTARRRDVATAQKAATRNGTPYKDAMNVGAVQGLRRWNGIVSQ